MIQLVKENLWNQLGASIDMLGNAIQMCPEENWNTGEKFWYNAFHTLFFLDFYLTMDVHHFQPPAPFTSSEFEDKMPERIYSKEELLGYLDFCRVKGKQLITSLNEETLQSEWSNISGTRVYPVFELLLYNMRHVQHHVGQLNLLLRQQIDEAPQWVRRAKEDKSTA